MKVGKQRGRRDEGSVAPGPEDEVLNDDERERFHWETRYPDKTARKLILIESVFVVCIIMLALIGLLVTWHGGIIDFVQSTCEGCGPGTLRKYMYMFFSGLLGGSMFGLKYLYKVVARGYWNQDRAIWRYTSPLLSAGLALATGALTDAGIFGFATSSAGSSSSFVALGFIVGYFADRASGKMQEVAETLFGAHPSQKRS
ncbi:hypothetical protein ACIPR8_09040 [Stenotrophomonas sp. LARHCG68]